MSGQVLRQICLQSLPIYVLHASKALHHCWYKTHVLTVFIQDQIKTSSPEATLGHSFPPSLSQSGFSVQSDVAG